MKRSTTSKVLRTTHRTKKARSSRSQSESESSASDGASGTESSAESGGDVGRIDAANLLLGVEDDVGSHNNMPEWICVLQESIVRWLQQGECTSVLDFAFAFTSSAEAVAQIGELDVRFWEEARTGGEKAVLASATTPAPAISMIRVTQ